MLATRNPRDAYRAVEFDARVQGANARELVMVCYERLLAALDSALFAASQHDNRLKSDSMTRALAALTALEMGLDRGNPLAPALGRMFAAARATVLDNVLTFSAAAVAALRTDFREIHLALAGEAPAGDDSSIPERDTGRPARD
jgi:flagellar protein FliS